MQNKQAEKQFFNEFATEQDYDVFDEHGYANLIKAFSQLVKPLSGERALDVGCGTGAFTLRLARLGLGGVGLDIAINNVIQARRNVASFDFLVGDCEVLPFPDDAFDLAVFSGILHHLPITGPTMAEAWRILRPGGRFFSYDPNVANPAMWVYRHPNSPLASRTGLTENERLLSKSEVESALRAARFSEVASVGISGITYRYVKSSSVARLLRVYNMIDTLFGLTGFSRRFGAFILGSAQKPFRSP